MKFKIGDVVRHVVTGGTYKIMQLPSQLTIENTNEPAYSYAPRNSMSSGCWWVRSATEMEDGRFQLVLD